ncbi:hypothetical protein FOXG_16229 [Fusarium oxysporum f. sp. lycopersici 4287]|uniref:Uncharacterized protein n=2 Tax=Fusarium oxysporum TaxID=5507 RepID=A0A0J9W6T3_FUSO4|nr:hypothetical protein FOXG_06860 [Fusarium oxysporum f. sp. lycopersici 4287]XP_018256755.1 hypothetical protein FOXG_16150 [Fusarium oxysporum f. sp. lycopersici 4287]XP_018256854.1 hypothetical protein FOXG_16229 [Fusarium oxysporum f. sp. lycopersici 4287]EXK23490.1 hypothetical protein FOMG_19732 [Fusarium oxysporum f. sp. melonis 26406]KNB04854.1 hypothetical protein FOXG_06860 [Fusarium oxysporum f. sp. lycopersici 4287]KNB18710.1 hypothetical protein FOXG_16150 [Fusarium oxysporum f. 
MSSSPELLYHILLTVIDYHVDPSGAKQSIYILGTNATLEAAKNSAFRVLDTLRHKPEDFVEYAIHLSSTEEWDHGDGVLVYAKAPAGQVLLISIQATPNEEKLLMDSNGGILMPKEIRSLHYVLQTMIDYNCWKIRGSPFPSGFRITV